MLNKPWENTDFENLINRPFWESTDFGNLSHATSMNQVSDIALRVLGRMRMAGREIVIICGPLTTGGLGSFDKNIVIFKSAIIMADALGQFVFDQTPFNAAMNKTCKKPNPGEYPRDILEEFFKPVFASGHVSKALFLPNWQTSFGARWERETLGQLDVRIEEYPREWLPKNFCHPSAVTL